MVLQKMEILPVNDLDIALHNFVNKDDKTAFYSCLQYNLDETRVSFCIAYMRYICCMVLPVKLLCWNILSILYSTPLLLRMITLSLHMSCSFLFSLMTFVLVQNKIAKDSDIQKFDDDDLVVKVGECLEVRSFIVFH